MKIIISQHTTANFLFSELIEQHGDIQEINIEVGENAQLKLVHDQLQEIRNFQCNYFIKCDRNSIVTFTLAIANGHQTQLSIMTFLQGEEAQFDLRGCYILSSQQSISIRTQQIHQAPYTKSNVHLFGIVANKALVSFEGTIRVEQQARQTNASQVNKNILLSPSAKAVSIPSLEILTNDVQCSHGSAVGQLDQGHIFYLMARGLQEVQAKQLLLESFIENSILDETVINTLQQKVQNLHDI